MSLTTKIEKRVEVTVPTSLTPDAPSWLITFVLDCAPSPELSLEIGHLGEQPPTHSAVLASGPPEHLRAVLNDLREAIAELERQAGLEPTVAVRTIPPPPQRPEALHPSVSLVDSVPLGDGAAESPGDEPSPNPGPLRIPREQLTSLAVRLAQVRALTSGGAV